MLAVFEGETSSWPGFNESKLFSLVDILKNQNHWTVSYVYQKWRCMILPIKYEILFVISMHLVLYNIMLKWFCTNMFSWYYLQYYPLFESSGRFVLFWSGVDLVTSAGGAATSEGTSKAERVASGNGITAAIRLRE